MTVSSLISESIDAIAMQPRIAFRSSAALGRQATFDELHDVWMECSAPGWDGYEAAPVEQLTYQRAYQIIDSLPLGFPTPSIGAEPDGQITLEWRKSPRRVLSISVDPDGYLHYAGMYGLDRRYGSIAVFSSAPAPMLALVREL